MKKNFYLLSAALAALCLASCAKEQLANEEGNIPTGNVIEFSATTEGDDSADGLKTYITALNKDGLYKVKWLSSDKIVVNGTESGAAQVVPDTYNTQANFTVEIEPAESYCAFYPAARFSKFDAATKKMTVFVPGDQAYRLYSTEKYLTFDSEASLMAAYSETTNLEFKHLMAYYQITVTGEEEGKMIRKIVVSRNGSNSNIAGAYILTFSDQDIAMVANTLTKPITYDCGEEGVALGSPVMIALPSINFTDGINFVITYTDGTSQAIYAKSLDLSGKRGKVETVSVPYKEESINTIGSAADWERFVVAVQMANRKTNPDDTALKHWLDEDGAVKVSADFEAESLTQITDKFTYTIDGCNHKITQTAAQKPILRNIRGTVKNLTLAGTMNVVDSDDRTHANAAPLADTVYAGALVSHVVNEMNITSTTDKQATVSGLVRIVMGGTLEYCENKGDITLHINCVGDSGHNVQLGGIATQTNTVTGVPYSGDIVFDHCVNSGKLIMDPAVGSTSSYVNYPIMGGIVAWVRSTRLHTISNCSNTGNILFNADLKKVTADVTATKSAYVALGGILGLSSNASTISLFSTTNPGAKGQIEIINCTNTGSLFNFGINKQNSQDFQKKIVVGGIAGCLVGTSEKYAKIENCSVILDDNHSIGTYDKTGDSSSGRAPYCGITGGLVGIGGYIEVSGCTVHGKLGTVSRQSVGCAGCIGAAMRPFYVHDSYIYPREMLMLISNWANNRAIVACCILQSGSTPASPVPTVEGSRIENCHLGGTFFGNGSEVKPELKDLSEVTKSSATCFNAENWSSNLVCGHNYKSGAGVTVSGNEYWDGKFTATTAAPAPMSLNAGNTYNY